MNTINKLTAFAVATLSLVACTQTDVDDSILTPGKMQEAVSDNAIHFSTYMSSAGQTRAGAAGAIDTDTLKGFAYAYQGETSRNYTSTQALQFGFGVFAYYTGTKTYGQAQGKTYTGEGTAYESNEQEPDFMYNQQVYYKEGSYAGAVNGEELNVKVNGAAATTHNFVWYYDPIKYWPNEVQDNSSNWKVDDQDNDDSNNQATASGTYGGNVSFFAYAPYVALPINSSSLPGGETEGIIKINNATTLTGSGVGNARMGDPLITYVIPAKGDEVVDLLWGTAMSNEAGVTGASNSGKSHTTGSNTYQEAILDGYTVNADLSKQKTTGTIGFNFKHALAKVGGSTNTTATAPQPNGLMIVLDLDNQKGVETGGVMEEIPDGTKYDNGTKEVKEDGKTKYYTKVTVKSINIRARSLVKDDSNNEPTDAGYTTTYLLKNQGDLDLATGQWDILRTANTITAANVDESDATKTPATTTHLINQDGTSNDAAAKLSTAIREVDLTSNANTVDGFKAEPLGVLTAAALGTNGQNVYDTEAFPLVFIPGTCPELTITVDYIVRTFDPNLFYKYSEVEQKITKKVTFNKLVELNKQYSLLIHLGLTSVKFTASVSDWDHTITLENGPDGVPLTEEAIEHVWIPRNVGRIESALDNATEAAVITVGSDNYAVVLKQTGRSEGDIYFSTETPIDIYVYKLKADGSIDTQVDLDGTNNDVYLLCRASSTHFHRGGEYTYNGSAPKHVTLTTNTADQSIVHAPVDIFLKIGGGSYTSASTTIYIWPSNRLPH